MAAEQLKTLIAHYLTAEADAAEDFCNSYMDRFEELCNELENEVEAKTYETYDDVRWICDAYCLDAGQLKQKLSALYRQL